MGSAEAPVKVLTTQELADMPEPEWLIDQMVAEKSTTMVYGPWGLGKSFMVLDMVLAASTGMDWFGDRRTARPLKTLYVVAEGAAWWHRRIEAFKGGRGAINEDNLLWVPEPVDLWSKPGDVERLEEVIQEHRPDMMIFDTWVRCTAAFGMNEDKATDTAQVIRVLDRLRDEYDVVPVIVHHPTKSGNFRGSGNQGASVERIIELQAVDQDPYSFIVHDEKGNHMEKFNDFRLKFESIQVAEDIKSAYLVFAGEWEGAGDKPPNYQQVNVAVQAVYRPGELFTFADIERLTNIPPGSMSKAIKDAVKKGYIQTTEGGYTL